MALKKYGPGVRDSAKAADGKAELKNPEERKNAYFLVLPAMIGCFVFTLYPIIYIFYLSTLSWDLSSENKKFVGLNNYFRLLQNQEFQQSLSETAVFTFFMVFISISLALVLAVWLNQKSRVRSFVQTAMFTPYVVSLVAVSILWMWIMDYDNGLLNFVVGVLGIPKVHWLDSPSTALISLIIIQVWKTLGYNTIILISGLQSISATLYETAKLDNAGRLTTFFKITVPLLSPSLFFLLIINITSSFQVFDSINVMTQGGPVNSTNLLVFWIYQTGFQFYNIGDAATGSVFLFLIVGTVTFINFKLLNKKVHYQ